MARLVSVNEVLRRAMYDANLTELDVSVELAVDPKTVRNWMRGQLPHARRRATLIKLLGIQEELAWPEVRKRAYSGEDQSDLVAVYPRRTAITRGDWLSFFASAESEIAVLADSAMFLVEDTAFVRLLCDKSAAGVLVRIALRARDETADAPNRSAVSLLVPAQRVGVELRLHDAVLYNSLFCCDDDLLVNQRAYGVPADESPVFHYRRSADGEIFQPYLRSFETVWSTAIRSPR
jgi:hypothetical protein